MLSTCRNVPPHPYTSEFQLRKNSEKLHNSKLPFEKSSGKNMYKIRIPRKITFLRSPQKSKRADRRTKAEPTQSRDDSGPPGNYWLTAEAKPKGGQMLSLHRCRPLAISGYQLVSRWSLTVCLEARRPNNRATAPAVRSQIAPAAVYLDPVDYPPRLVLEPRLYRSNPAMWRYACTL